RGIDRTRCQRARSRTERRLDGPSAASESNPGRDLRAMEDHVESKVIVVEVGGESAVTDLGKNVPREIDTQHTLNLPHQVSAYPESSDLAAHGGVKRLVKVVAGMQSDIGIEPAIISRDCLPQLPVQDKRELVCNPDFGRTNDSTDRGATSLTFEVERIYACAQSNFFRLHEILNH